MCSLSATARGAFLRLLGAPARSAKLQPQSCRVDTRRLTLGDLRTSDAAQSKSLQCGTGTCEKRAEEAKLARGPQRPRTDEHASPDLGILLRTSNKVKCSEVAAAGPNRTLHDKLDFALLVESLT